MAKDLFEQYGIKQKPVDLFEQQDVYMPKESKGFSGVASDAYNKAIEAALNIPSQLLNLPGEVYGAGKQVLTQPKRALQNVGAGLGELGHGILSAPGNVRDYLQRKDLIPESTPSLRLPESILPKEYNYADALGVQGEEYGDALLRGLPTGAALAPFASAISSRIPGITNKSIANKISKDKKFAIQEAKEGYDQFFDKAKSQGVGDIERPSIAAGDIVRHTQPKYHESLIKFFDNPTLENAHWAQSDLGFIIRHLKKVDEKNGLSSTQHKTLKNAIEAQNRIKHSMFKEKNMAKNPKFEQEYNQLSGDYAQKVIPYKELQELSEYDNKKLTRNNLIKKLLNNDEFKLGLGKKYPQIYINKALRSNVAKTIGGGALAGLGFAEGKKLLR